MSAMESSVTETTVSVRFVTLRRNTNDHIVAFTVQRGVSRVATR
jgi:hypothetical protein